MLTMREVEKNYILEALAKFGENLTSMSKATGIPTATLYRKLKKYGITTPRRVKQSAKALQAHRAKVKQVALDAERGARANEGLPTGA